MRDASEALRLLKAAPNWRLRRRSDVVRSWHLSDLAASDPERLLLGDKETNAEGLWNFRF
jgi:hypothetical protein